MSFTKSDAPKVRVLVIGDSGTGKSALVHQICHGEPLENAAWTVGCGVDVRLFESSHGKRKFFVEFFDLGGAKKYQPSRGIFYSQINGILLVFDLSNRKSYQNLRKWIHEIVEANKRKPIEEHYVYTGELLPGSHSPNIVAAPRHSHSPKLSGLGFDRAKRSAHSAGGGGGGGGGGAGGMRVGHASLGSLPVVVVGNKLDLIEPDAAAPGAAASPAAAASSPARLDDVAAAKAKASRTYNTLKEFGLESFNVSALRPFDDEATAKLHEFFDKVIERRYYRRDEDRKPYLASPYSQVYARRESGGSSNSIYNTGHSSSLHGQRGSGSSFSLASFGSRGTFSSHRGSSSSSEYSPSDRRGRSLLQSEWRSHNSDASAQPPREPPRSLLGTVAAFASRLGGTRDPNDGADDDGTQDDGLGV